MNAKIDRVRELLGHGGIRRVALVDDAYDYPRHVDEGAWRMLREAPEQLTPEQELALGPQLESLVQVDEFRVFLAELGLDVRVFGRDEAHMSLGDYQADIWFVDLFWEADRYDPDDDDPRKTSAQFAGRLAGEVLARRDPEERALPMVVLMSSNEAALGGAVEHFVRAANIPIGCFETLAKPSVGALLADDDRTTDSLLDKLEAWLKNPDFRRRIFYFFRTVQDAASDAKGKFIDILQGMSVNDYAYILKEGIKKDGHLLGDYLLWLMEPLFVHHLHESERFQAARRALDAANDVDGYLPLNPSPHYEELYQCRVWKRAAGLHSEDVPVKATKVSGSATVPPDRAASSIQMVHLYQGDLLQSQRDPNRSWLVISPSCDLAFRVGTRSVDPEISVYLMPGEVLTGEAATQWNGEGKTTRLFPPGEVSALIVWQPKRVCTSRYGDIPGFIENNGLRRSWCLRRKYVLELVHGWSSSVTRVGLPVSPPAVQRVCVTLRVLKAGVWSEPETWSPGGLLRYDDTGKKKKTFVSLHAEVARNLSEICGGAEVSDLLGLGKRWVQVQSDAPLWTSASKRVRAYWGSGVPADPGKSVEYLLSIFEEFVPRNELEPEESEET